MNCQECKERLFPTDPEIGYTFKGRYYPPLCQGCPQKDSSEEQIIKLEERLNDLEAISAMPGQIPRRYYEQAEQLQGQINFLQNKLNAALDRGKKRQEAGEKQQPKSTYKGLKVGT